MRIPTRCGRAIVAAGLGLVLATPASGAILNTFLRFDDDQPGWSGGTEIAFSASGGNTEVLGAALAGQVQWQRTRNRVRLLADYQRQTSRGQEIDEESAAHLRHNFRLSGPLHSLAFAQIQRSPFRRLESRTLFGAGLRADLVRGERGDLAVGAAHMVELEDLEGASETSTDQRLSLFLTGALTLSSNTTLSTTAFAQPLWTDLEDLRATGTATLRVEITDRVSLRLGAGFEHDARPPEGVKETDWSTKTALGVDF